jgi:hypothetical protein
VSPYPAGQSHEARISPPFRHVGSADWSAVQGGSHSGRRLGLCLALGRKKISLYPSIRSFKIQSIENKEIFARIFVNRLILRMRKITSELYLCVRQYSLTKNLFTAHAFNYSKLSCSNCIVIKFYSHFIHCAVRLNNPFASKSLCPLPRKILMECRH